MTTVYRATGKPQDGADADPETKPDERPAPPRAPQSPDVVEFRKRLAVVKAIRKGPAMSLTTSLKKAGRDLHAEDKAAILANTRDARRRVAAAQE